MEKVTAHGAVLRPLVPPSQGQSIVRQSLEDLMKTVEPDLDVDDLSLSLIMRGVKLTKPTRMALLEALGECIDLEIECVGSKFYDHLKQQDRIARRGGRMEPFKK